MHEIAGTTLLAALNLLFFLVFLYIFITFVRLLVKLLKAFFKSPRQTAVSIPLRLICIAVAALAFPAIVTWAMKAFAQIINFILVHLPEQIQQNLPNLQNICDSSYVGDCIYGTSIILLSILTETMRSFVQQLSVDTFPATDSLLAILTFLIIYWLIDYAMANNTGSSILGSFSGLAQRISAFVRQLRPSTRSNLVFFVILALGIYLSLTAIIAIPPLQEPADNQASAKQIEDLRRDLTALVLPGDQFDKQFPPTIAEEFEITNSVVYKSIVLDQQSNSNSGSRLGIELLAKDQSAHLNGLRKLWTNLTLKYKAAQNDEVQIAAETFEIDNKDRRGVRERNQQFLSIDIWFRRLQSEMFETLNACRAAVERYGSLSSSLFDSVQSFFGKSAPTVNGTTSNVLSSVLSQKSRDINDALSQAYKECNVPTPDNPVPVREEYGRYLGVFGLAAEWLLKTESLPLVLITGLLGFGFLGAACSSFIRNAASRSPGDALVPNLASVVIRGGSAAILVFLAVYGGLAIFAGTSANPNPYVVLFTCLAAAVFSDDAWAWGADKFRSSLNSSRREGDRQLRTEDQPKPGNVAGG